MNIKRIVRRIRVSNRRNVRRRKVHELRGLLQSLKNFEDWTRSMNEHSSTAKARRQVYGDMTHLKKRTLEARARELIAELCLSKKQLRRLAE